MTNIINLVIKIEEEEYQNILHTGKASFRAVNAIEAGTPLPKGYGDLIDRQALINNGIKKEFCDWYDEIKMAEPIIEADKESK